MVSKGRCNNAFTPEETTSLAAGGKVYIGDFESEGSKTFVATVHFGEENGKPGKRIIPEFR